MTNAEKALMIHEEWNGKFETTPKMQIRVIVHLVVWRRCNI